MSPENIRVLIVDDSALIRTFLADQLESVSDITVVGKAINGKHGIELVRELEPDVVVLDLQMPVMNGLEALEAILDIRPIPVLVFSSATLKGADLALDALDRGAIDFLPKPSDRAQIRETMEGALVERIRALAETRPVKGGPTTAPRNRAPESHAPENRQIVLDAETEAELAEFAIAIGVSTGGPPALATLFQDLAPPQPPILVVQHMLAPYVGSLARRLDSLTPLQVEEAVSGEVPLPNHVYLAPGGHHMRLRTGRQPRIICEDGPCVKRHKPSVDVLMKSVAETYGANAIGVIMTGMGQDGVEGCQAIRDAGGYVLGQDKTSSVVYGMNKLAFVSGAVDEQFNLSRLAAVLDRRVRERMRSPCVPTGCTRHSSPQGHLPHPTSY